MDRELPAAQIRRDRLRRWARPLLALAIVGLGLFGLGRWLRPGVDSDRLRTAVVERGDLEVVVGATGTVQPASEQVLASRLEARVLAVHRTPGALLEEGDLILSLDPEAARRVLDQIEAREEEARARRRELEAQAEEAVTDRETRRRIQELELEELIYLAEQQRQLFDEGLISEAALRASRTAVERARLELEALARGLEASRRSFAEQVRSLDAELQRLASEREAAAEGLASSEVRSPRAGVLTWVTEEEGVLVRPGDRLARIADLQRFRVEASTSDLHAARLHPGQAVRVKVGDVTLDGAIERVLPEVESGGVRFRVSLERADDPALRVNRRVEVLVITRRLDGVLTVDRGPFANGSGPQNVFVVVGDELRRRRVELGASGDRHIEVVRGLDEGEVVVVSDLRERMDQERLKLR